MRMLLTVLLLASLVPVFAAAPKDPAEGGPVWLKDQAGAEVILYQARSPARPRAGRLGLILCFHGKGGDSGSLLGATQAALEKAGTRGDYVVIGLKAKETGWTDADDAPVLAFATWALAHYPIDVRRVYGIGYSSGAFYLNRFAPSHSALMAGAITWVGGQSGVTDPEPATAAELYWITGQQDRIVLAERCRANMQDFVRHGFQCIYREMRDYGHDTAREPCQEDAFRFLRALRNRRQALGADDQAFIDQFADPDKARKALGSAAAWARVVQLGGPQAAPAVLAGLTSDKDDQRGNAATACATTMFDGRVVAALAPLLAARSPALREAVVAALTAQAEWDQPGAQEALCAWLEEPRHPAAERRAVTAGLGKVERIDAQGAFRFARVLWTLVELLDDEDGGVRALALAGLEPAKADPAAFGYHADAGKAARAAAVEKWRSWCAGVCGARPSQPVAVAPAPVPAP